MKNGDAFRVFTDEVVAILAGKKVIDYYREPLPSAIDQKLFEVVGRFMAATPAQRRTFQETVGEQRSLFGIYGHRAATLSVRQEAPQWLQSGLVGYAIANYTIPESRDVNVGLAVFHHCARKLGLDPAELFTEAAVYATPPMADALIAFGGRTDVSLRSFGWRELKTPEGVRYTFSWA